MKLKYLVFLLLGIIAFSCSDDDDDKDDFDPIAQALIDDEILVEFLQSHYFTPEKEIDTILNGETPLYSIVETEDIVYNEINYKMYYYVDTEGVGENPSRNDSIQMLYRGFTLDSIKFDENTKYTSTKSWFVLPSLIPGWRFGMPHYNEGEKVIYPDESFGYENTGSGFFFIPSGLAYGNSGSISIAPNESIYFFIELGKVVIADSDNDGVINNDEDVDGDGDVLNDDTDEDLVPNYIDIDDDGDRVKTIDEDVDGDGNPMNDDTDGDGKANYLDDDDDGDGKKTIDEDTNRNGDPTDDDTDGDGIPNYLDADS
ncbi:MAG: FKBP-type peptidyl-prolyl cis-trans isomerase [Flavobacteriaceae bacterium]|nr:FKBP-type peptidyl-prolyl cis-trans isomerase [Flavobacteriaceae bacterium]